MMACMVVRCVNPCVVVCGVGGRWGQVTVQVRIKRVRARLLDGCR